MPRAGMLSEVKGEQEGDEQEEEWVLRTPLRDSTGAVDPWGGEAFGGRGRPRSFPSACTTFNPQTHESQVFHLHSRLSK